MAKTNQVVSAGDHFVGKVFPGQILVLAASQED